jgi:hypothetical protein
MFLYFISIFVYVFYVVSCFDVFFSFYFSNKQITRQTVRKLAKIPEKQEKNWFSLSISAKNTKNSSF